MKRAFAHLSASITSEHVPELPGKAIITSDDKMLMWFLDKASLPCRPTLCIAKKEFAIRVIGRIRININHQFSIQRAVKTGFITCLRKVGVYR